MWHVLSIRIWETWWSYLQFKFYKGNEGLQEYLAKLEFQPDSSWQELVVKGGGIVVIFRSPA